MVSIGRDSSDLLAKISTPIFNGKKDAFYYVRFFNSYPV